MTTKSRKAFEFTVRQAAQLTPSEIDIAEHFFHSGEAYGRKQAPEEAVAVASKSDTATGTERLLKGLIK